MKRILGLDYGSKTVGVAVSDPLGYTAQGVEIIRRKQLARIEELVKEYDADTIVLGFPKHMNNDIGDRAAKSLEFRDMLERRTGKKVVMWDERLTTVAADRILDETGVKGRDRKEVIDQIAATFILQGYLDSLENGRK